MRCGAAAAIKTKGHVVARTKACPFIVGGARTALSCSRTVRMGVLWDRPVTPIAGLVYLPQRSLRAQEERIDRVGTDDLLSCFYWSRGCCADDEAFMRVIPLVSITFAALSLSTIGAYAAPWCAEYGGRVGGTNCGFYSFEQCRATISGIGGFCRRNSFDAYGREPRRRYRRGY